MSLKSVVTAGAIALLAVSSTYAGRIETRLDGNDWTLDGLPVLVPNCWNKIDAADGDPGDGNKRKSGCKSVPATTYVRRRGVYSRALPGASAGRRYFVRCEGASQKATVRVNGRTLGVHKGSFTAFCFEATAAMKPDGNLLEIEVSNEIDATIPPLDADFSLCGGLYRSVWLVETDPVCIDPTIDGGPGVRVFAEPDGTVRVEADVSGADDAVVDWTPRKVANPRLWSPEEPNVYEVAVTVRKGGWSDTVRQPFGFCTSEIRKDGFYLNGVKRKVRGVNRHQDLAGMGWEVSPAQDERDIRLIKAMGADSVRLAHYPQNDNVFSLCDRYGLMVWTEVPNVNLIGGAEYMANARTMLREMIAQKRNHPSVCWWGVWNELRDKVECAEGGSWIEKSKEFVALVNELDPSRPVVAATCTPEFPAINASVPNICANTYPGWGGRLHTMKAVIDDYFARNVLTMFALSEYGAGGSVNQHQNPVSRPKNNSRFHPEEWQTKVHMDDLRHIIGEDRIWGSFAWVMFDYASDERREGDHSGVNDKGLVTRDRVTLKDAFYLYKANWNPAPMLHLCGKRMKRKSASDGAAEIDVVAFSNVGDVTLTVNGKVAGRAKPDDIRSVTFKAVALKAGVNTIVVESGGLRDGMEFTITGAAPTATPVAASGGAGKYDVAAYVWPAYQPEPRWAELGIFDAGKGEWQNVWEAVPKWEGHRQPLVPLWGYENEADPKVMEKKIDVAVSHGVNVFIYDWYWYCGRPFLEDALDKGFLGAKNNEKMKFYIMWANHHVTRRWNNKVVDRAGETPIWRSWVDMDEFKKISKRWIEMYFSRPNYYRIGGKPVLMVYQLKNFVEGLGGEENAAKALDWLRAECANAGLGGLHLMGCDYQLNQKMVKRLGVYSATLYCFVHCTSPKGNPDYSKWAEKASRRFDAAKKDLELPMYFAHASVGWDTNPRYPVGSVQPTVMNSTPEKFEQSLRRAKEWCDKNTPEGAPKLVTVNAWNEWTEGSCLEPDTHFRFGYLEAVKRVFGSAEGEGVSH